VHVAYAKEDLVIGDLRRAVVVDLGREALGGIVRHLDLLCAVIDRVLNEGEEAVDRLTELPIERLPGLEVDHTRDRVAQHDDEERARVHTEAAALEGERVGVQVLRTPLLARCLEIGNVLSGASSVAAGDG